MPHTQHLPLHGGPEPSLHTPTTESAVIQEFYAVWGVCEAVSLQCVQNEGQAVTGKPHRQV